MHIYEHIMIRENIQEAWKLGYGTHSVSQSLIPGQIKLYMYIYM